MNRVHFKAGLRCRSFTGSGTEGSAGALSGPGPTGSSARPAGARLARLSSCELLLIPLPI